MTREKSAKNLAASPTAKTHQETKSGASQKKTSCWRQKSIFKPQKTIIIKFPAILAQRKTRYRPQSNNGHTRIRQTGGRRNFKYLYIRAHASLRG
jgi:hypothetical protein